MGRQARSRIAYFSLVIVSPVLLRAHTWHLGRRAGLVGSCVMVGVGVGGDVPEERMVVRPASVPCRAYLLALSLRA